MKHFSSQPSVSWPRVSNTQWVCCSSSSHHRLQPVPGWGQHWLLFLLAVSFYLWDEWEEVKGAVLISLCVSICLQFLLVWRMSVCPSLVATQNFSYSGVLAMSESCSFPLRSARIPLITLSPTVWLRSFVSVCKSTGINMFSRLRENAGMWCCKWIFLLSYSSAFPSFPPTFSSFSFSFFFFFLLSECSSQNVRTTLVLLQTKLKQHQPLRIKETSLRI